MSHVRIMLLGCFLLVTFGWAIADEQPPIGVDSKPATQPTSKPKPILPPIQGMQALLAIVPREIYPTAHQPWTAAKVDAANAVWTKEAMGREVTLLATARWIGRTPSRNKKIEDQSQNGYQIRSAPIPKETWQISVLVSFTKDHEAELAKLNSGDEVVLTGTITRCELERFALSYSAFC